MGQKRTLRLTIRQDETGPHVYSIPRAWEELLGYPYAEILAMDGRQFMELFVHPDDLQDSMTESARLSEPGTLTVDFVARYATVYGWIPIAWTVYTGGNMTHCLGEFVVPDAE